MKEDALAAKAEFWPSRLGNIYILLGYAYTSLSNCSTSFETTYWPHLQGRKFASKSISSFAAG